MEKELYERMLSKDKMAYRGQHSFEVQFSRANLLRSLPFCVLQFSHLKMVITYASQSHYENADNINGLALPDT